MFPFIKDRTSQPVSLPLTNLPLENVVQETGKIVKPYKDKVSYDSARMVIKSMAFKSLTEYRNWLRNSDVETQKLFYIYPEHSYSGKGWVSTSHFLSRSDEAMKQYQIEQGRKLGLSGVGAKARKKNAELSRTSAVAVKENVVPQATPKVDSQPSIMEIIVALFKHDVPDHVVKAVFDSQKPSFDDIKGICAELISLRNK